MGARSRPILFSAIVLAIAAQCCLAASLGTDTQHLGNYNYGIMFDISTGSQPVQLTSFVMNMSSISQPLRLFTRPGTYVGNERSSDGWTLIDSQTLTGSGPYQPTYYDPADITVAANSRMALYFSTIQHGTIYYNNGTGVGNVAAANNDLSPSKRLNSSEPRTLVHG